MKFTAPLPRPLAPEVRCSHGALLDDDQSHEEPLAATLNVPLPPVEGWIGLEPLTLMLQATPCSEIWNI